MVLAALTLSAVLAAAYAHVSRPRDSTPTELAGGFVSKIKRRKLTVYTRESAAATKGKEKIVVILIDSLRRDHLGMNGYPRAVSPTLDRLAREGFHLANMIAHSSQTVPSTVSMLTSLLPHQSGIQFYSKTQGFTPTKERVRPLLAESVTTMAEYFSVRGFYTAAIVVNPWLTVDHGFGQGFDRYVEVNGHTKRVGYVFDGRIVNDEAKKLLLAHRDQKSLFYLHYMDVHYPYATNPRVRPVFRSARGRAVDGNASRSDSSPEDIEYSKALYDEGILYMDGLLADLLGFLASERLDDDTTVLVTSDHGDEFHEHGGTGHGTTLYAELVNTFAVFWNPRRFRKARVEHYTQSVDILPTLMEAYGVPRPATLMGRSALAAGDSAAASTSEREILSELGDRKSIICRGWKYLIDLDTATEELYEVGSSAAIERENRTDRVELMSSLRQQLAPVVRLARGGAPAVAGIDPESEERLKALGYLR